MLLVLREVLSRENGREPTLGDLCTVILSGGEHLPCQSDFNNSNDWNSDGPRHERVQRGISQRLPGQSCFR